VFGLLKSQEIGLQKLKSRHDSMESRHDSIKSRRDSIKSRRDFTFILPLRWFLRGGEKLFSGGQYSESISFTLIFQRFTYAELTFFNDLSRVKNACKPRFQPTEWPQKEKKL
jgi:hypothetical protein